MTASRYVTIEDGGQPYALALTKAGVPGHPLYLRRDLTLFPWSVP